MSLPHDTVADVKPHARSLADTLSGEKGLEDAVLNLFGNTWAVVDNVDTGHVGGRIYRGANGNHSPLVYGINRVDNEVGPT